MRAWLALVLVLAGCGTTGRTPAPSDVADDANATWQLTSGRTRAGEIPLIDDHPVTLIVEASQIGGTAACNSYAARLVNRGGHVAVTDLSMTVAGCEAPILAVETAYIDALSAVTAIQLRDDALVLTGPDVELRFDRLADAPVADLIDQAWELDSLVVGDVASAPAGEPATLELRSDGTLLGSTGCRGFHGEWVERGNQILATSLSMDGAECPAALAVQDSHVVSVIGDGFVPSIDGGLLTLTDPGSVGLVYRAGE